MFSNTVAPGFNPFLQTVGKFKENVLNPLSHQLIRSLLAYCVSEIHLVRSDMVREIHDADEIHGWKIIVQFPFRFLLQNGKRGIEHRPFIEMELVGHLNLHDEARPVRVCAFHINPYILLPF